MLPNDGACRTWDRAFALATQHGARWVVSRKSWNAAGRVCPDPWPYYVYDGEPAWGDYLTAALDAMLFCGTRATVWVFDLTTVPYHVAYKLHYDGSE